MIEKTRKYIMGKCLKERSSISNIIYNTIQIADYNSSIDKFEIPMSKVNTTYFIESNDYYGSIDDVKYQVTNEKLLIWI